MRHCFAFFSCALLVTSCCCLYHSSADDETSNVLKRSVKMFAHVLALCFILRLLKRSNHYAPNRIVLIVPRNILLMNAKAFCCLHKKMFLSF